MQLFVDASVFAYALGAVHPQKAGCLALLSAAGRGDAELHASVEMIQELAFHRMRVAGRAVAIGQARDAAAMCALRPFDIAVLDKALDLTTTTSIGGRDAVHAATALLWGFDAIVSPDRDFDGVPGLRRIDPAEALG